MIGGGDRPISRVMTTADGSFAFQSSTKAAESRRLKDRSPRGLASICKIVVIDMPFAEDLRPLDHRADRHACVIEVSFGTLEVNSTINPGQNAGTAIYGCQ